ncbi:MAG: hypothetical protein IIC26_03960 [Chloroflexi bacterium]|nr:hypothetical protein [Chloroflexota bacterium]
MPRGGSRPGAGAPRGNVNALKHGLHSRQLRQAVAELARSPAFRAVLARFAQRAAQQRTAYQKEQAAALAVAVWLRYTHALDQGHPWPGPTPPPLTKRAVRLLAKRLVGETIKQGLVRFTRNPPNEEGET